MNRDEARLWTDRSFLQNVQYRTDANLAARQSIYAYGHPQRDLPSLALRLAALHGGETVADVGCGNGAYLAELARRQHVGSVLGIDLSVGMLLATRSRAPGVRLAAGDAAALPLRDDAADLTLAMHMLYHVPDPLAAIRELRRITRPGGKVVVVLNGHDHLRELRGLVTSVLADTTSGEALGWERLHLDDGADLLAAEFTTVSRHDFTGKLRIPDRQPVQDYVRSMRLIQARADPDAVTAAVSNLIPDPGQEPFRVRTHSGCLICS
jgi:SAM-dependent methyltransferase